MNAVECPNCGNLNSTEENYCLNCGTSILNLQPPSFAPIESRQNQAFQSYGFNVPSSFNSTQYENPLGSKVFAWYRIFCGLVALTSLVPALIGLLAIINNGSNPTPKEQNDAIEGGIILIVYGLFYFIPFILALVLPRKPGHWIFGMVLIALSSISCIFLPFAIPLLFYWVKPETRAYLKLNQSA